MRKIYISAILLLLIILMNILVKLLFSGYFAWKHNSEFNICYNLKKNETCICEKYSSPVCHIEIKPQLLLRFYFV